MNYLIFDSEGEMLDVINIDSNEHYDAYLLQNPDHTLVQENELQEEEFDDDIYYDDDGEDDWEETDQTEDDWNDVP